MKRLFKSVVVIFLLLGLVSCSDDFSQVSPEWARGTWRMMNTGVMQDIVITDNSLSMLGITCVFGESYHVGKVAGMSIEGKCEVATKTDTVFEIRKTEYTIGMTSVDYMKFELEGTDPVTCKYYEKASNAYDYSLKSTLTKATSDDPVVTSVATVSPEWVRGAWRRKDTGASDYLTIGEKTWNSGGSDVEFGLKEVLYSNWIMNGESDRISVSETILDIVATSDNVFEVCLTRANKTSRVASFTYIKLEKESGNPFECKYYIKPPASSDYQLSATLVRRADDVVQKAPEWVQGAWSKSQGAGAEELFSIGESSVTNDGETLQFGEKQTDANESCMYEVAEKTPYSFILRQTRKSGGATSVDYIKLMKLTKAETDGSSTCSYEWSRKGPDGPAYVYVGEAEKRSSAYSGSESEEAWAYGEWDFFVGGQSYSRVCKIGPESFVWGGESYKYGEEKHKTTSCDILVNDDDVFEMRRIAITCDGDSRKTTHTKIIRDCPIAFYSKDSEASNYDKIPIGSEELSSEVTSDDFDANQASPEWVRSNWKMDTGGMEIAIGRNAIKLAFGNDNSTVLGFGKQKVFSADLSMLSEVLTSSDKVFEIKITTNSSGNETVSFMKWSRTESYTYYQTASDTYSTGSDIFVKK